ncbi:MAG TPA: hypothetical protein VFV11_09040 [Solimonas sp.]|nr:hypothetical protein [Solimonas sp.]
MSLPRVLGALFAAFLALTACAKPPMPAPPTTPPPTPPVAGFVTDLPGFERFIATAPTPAEFRARYPDVLLVLPGDIATKEFRMNNSRYFAKLDAQGRINGGRFM